MEEMMGDCDSRTNILRGIMFQRVTLRSDMIMFTLMMMMTEIIDLVVTEERKARGTHERYPLSPVFEGTDHQFPAVSS